MAFTGFSFGMSMAVTVSVMKPMLASDHEKLSKISISGLIYSCTDTCMWSQKHPPIGSRLRSWVDTALWRLWERRQDAKSFLLQHDLSSFYTRGHLSVCMCCVYVLLVSAFFMGPTCETRHTSTSDCAHSSNVHFIARFCGDALLFLFCKLLVEIASMCRPHWILEVEFQKWKHKEITMAKKENASNCIMFANLGTYNHQGLFVGQSKV